MTLACRTAGLTVQVTGAPRWREFAAEACAGQQLTDDVVGERPDVCVSVGTDGDGFDLTGYDPLTRGAWSDGRSVVMVDAGGSGADLLVRPRQDQLQVSARIRPSWRHRGLGLLDPARQVLLLRAALIQYPAMWWAGVRGLAPLHVSAVVVDGRGVLLAGPGGVGKSTLVSGVAPPTGAPVSDNLCVSSGDRVHGLLEPARAADGTGRRMPHGRRESAWTARLPWADPDRILVLRRGGGTEPQVCPVDARETARALTTGTYAAGELRRYWAFAATLALGTGLGPAHPPVEAVARRLAVRVPAVEVTLASRPGSTLPELLELIDTSPVPRPAGR